MGLTYAPAQGFQNAINNECRTNFLIKLWASQNRQVVCRLYEARFYGRIPYNYKHINNSPTPTDLNDIHKLKKSFFLNEGCKSKVGHGGFMRKSKRLRTAVTNF